MPNSFSINNTSVNSSGFVFPLSDSITENANISSGTISSLLLVLSLSNSLSLTTNVTVGYKTFVSEILNILQTHSSMELKVEKVSSAIRTFLLTTSTVSFLSGVIDIINILSNTRDSFRLIANDTLYISSTISELLKAVERTLESFILTATEGKGYTFYISLESNASLTSSSSNVGSLFNNNKDVILLKIPLSTSGDKYLTYIFMPETMSVTNYDNFNFDGAAIFNGKNLFINSSGLYELGGILDDTVPVVGRFATAAMTFGTSNLKQVPAIYLGVSSSGNTYLKVKVDGKKDVFYNLHKHTENLQTQKINIGKGLIGRYFQFEIVTSSDMFSLESIDFYPIELKRKL